MSVTITVGSNSYITLADANTYFDERLNSDAWGDADDNEKKRALITSSKAIDRLNFGGLKADEDQTMQFPRSDDASVPGPIADAVCENAITILDRNIEDEIEDIRISQEHVADVKVSYNTFYAPENIMAGIVSATAWIMLKPFLIDAGIVSTKRV